MRIAFTFVLGLAVSACFPEVPAGLATAVLSDVVVDAPKEDFVAITIHRTFEDGAHQTVKLLRPTTWATARGLSEGAQFEFEATEGTFNGTFTIDSIAPWVAEANEPSEGNRMVTGTFVTENSPTYTLDLSSG